MRFVQTSDNSTNAIEVVDTVSGRVYTIMGADEDYDAEEIKFIVNLINLGDSMEQGLGWSGIDPLEGQFEHFRD